MTARLVFWQELYNYYSNSNSPLLHGCLVYRKDECGYIEQTAFFCQDRKKVWLHAHCNNQSEDFHQNKILEPIEVKWLHWKLKVMPPYNPNGSFIWPTMRFNDQMRFNNISYRHFLQWGSWKRFSTEARRPNWCEEDYSSPSFSL